MGRTGTAESKLEALKAAGVRVALKPGEIAKLLAKK
jgi:succinyl-CoA synthetase alpha subunit